MSAEAKEGGGNACFDFFFSTSGDDLGQKKNQRFFFFPFRSFFSPSIFLKHASAGGRAHHLDQRREMERRAWACTFVVLRKREEQLKNGAERKEREGSHGRKKKKKKRKGPASLACTHALISVPFFTRDRSVNG